MQSSTVASFGMLIVLEIAPEMNRLGRRHHADVAFNREIPLADLAARVGAIEDREVFVLQVRRTFQRHRTQTCDVGSLDFLPGEAQMGEEVELRVVELFLRDFECRHLLVADGPAVEPNLMSKACFSAPLIVAIVASEKPLAFSVAVLIAAR